MGIQGLLPLLKSIMDDAHVSAYANHRVAVDAYSWLHRGAYACSTELCLSIPTDKCIEFCMARVHLLRQFNVTPVLVFDGGRLPSKQNTEAERNKSREENRALGVAMLKEGNKDAAYKYFQKAVDITPAIASAFTHRLRAENVDFIVAPYEADAQLAYMAKTGDVAAVISEDSDLLVFGCPRVFFKMDKMGYGKELRLSNLGAVEEVSFAHWDHSMFQQMCILAGCDYLDSVKGFGIKRAHTLIQQARSGEKAIRRLRFEGKHTVPKNYEQDFRRAHMAFLYQRVYDRKSQTLVHLNLLPHDFEKEFPDTAFLGPSLSQEIATSIATGLIDPETHQPYPAPTSSSSSSSSSRQSLDLVDGSEVYHLSQNGDDSFNGESSSEFVKAPRRRSSLTAFRGGANSESYMSHKRQRSFPIISAQQKNKINSYFLASTNATQRSFVPPRNSSTDTSSSTSVSESSTSSRAFGMIQSFAFSPHTPKKSALNGLAANHSAGVQEQDSNEVSIIEKDPQIPHRKVDLARDSVEEEHQTAQEQQESSVAPKKSLKSKYFAFINRSDVNSVMQSDGDTVSHSDSMSPSSIAVDSKISKQTPPMFCRKKFSSTLVSSSLTTTTGSTTVKVAKTHMSQSSEEEVTDEPSPQRPMSSYLLDVYRYRQQVTSSIRKNNRSSPQHGVDGVTPSGVTEANGSGNPRTHSPTQDLSSPRSQPQSQSQAESQVESQSQPWSRPQSPNQDSEKIGQDQSSERRSYTMLSDTGEESSFKLEILSPPSTTHRRDKQAKKDSNRQHQLLSPPQNERNTSTNEEQQQLSSTDDLKELDAFRFQKPPDTVRAPNQRTRAHTILCTPPVNFGVGEDVGSNSDFDFYS